MSRFLICSFALVLLYPAGIDMYLVGLPRIAADLNASEAQLHIAFSVYLADLFKIDNSHGGRFKTVLLTFLPPALLYLIFPNGFIYGIGGAGLCATIWAVIIPAVLAIKARKKFPNQMFTVWGGNLIPAIVILFGITVILCWFGNVFNVLPKFG